MLLTETVRGKEIREANIAIVSDCPLRCGYCFVDKESAAEMSSQTAFDAVTLILDSPGQRKGIHLYGGEPLLRFDLLREIVDFAWSESRRRGKELFPGVCTNGVLLRREHLGYFRRERVHLSISLNGTKDSHDRFRRLKSGRGSFDLIAPRLPEAFEVMGEGGLTALMCVHPETVGMVWEDFQRLVEMGFRVINVEVIHGFPWPEPAREAFRRGLRLIEDFVFAQARQGRFIYVESFLRYIRGTDVAFDICPMHSNLCVFPGGDLSLYPHAFAGSATTGDGWKIGRAGEGLSGRFRACRFDPASPDCGSCAQRYYEPGPLSNGSEVFDERCRAFKGMAGRAIECARTERALRDYVKEGLRRVLSYHA